MRPANGIMIKSIGATKFFFASIDFFKIFLDVVEKSHFIKKSLWATFRTCSIVSLDVDDQCVIQFAHLVDGIDDSSKLMVGMG